MSDRPITINVLPQNPAAWLFIAVAVCFVAFFWTLSNKLIAEANAHAREVEAQAHAK